MVAETRLSKHQFIYPYFVIPGSKNRQAIEAMPGIHRFSVDELVRDVETGLKLGIDKVLLFGVGEAKAEDAHSAYHDHSVVAEAVRALKGAFGEQLYVITDVCLCAYTTHGHCGLIEHDYVQNDPSLEVLARMALKHAECGADMVAPSDMMDGRVAAIRSKLDANGFSDTPIMSYSVKFASAYYGPFREAADSAPGRGSQVVPDGFPQRPRVGSGSPVGRGGRGGYADGQAGTGLSGCHPVCPESSRLPLACYNVSAEYSMVKAAAKAGFIDEQRIVLENMHAFARAGADVIISYHTRDLFEKGWM